MGRKCNDTSGPFNFRGCDLTAEWLLAREHVRVRLPAAAPAFARSGVKDEDCRVEAQSAKTDSHSFGTGYGPAGQFPISRAPACAAESPKLSLPGAAPGRLANFTRGRGRKVMHLPCKQAQAGALPAVLHHFALRGESDSGEPHKLSLSGCNSRPRYQFQGSDPAIRP